MRTTSRRAGDPVNLVADVGCIRSTLDWKPQYDNLDTIVAHALAWEVQLAADQGRMASSGIAAA